MILHTPNCSHLRNEVNPIAHANVKTKLQNRCNYRRLELAIRTCVIVFALFNSIFRFNPQQTTARLVMQRIKPITEPSVEDPKIPELWADEVGCIQFWNGKLFIE